RWLLPMSGPEDVLEGQALAIAGGRIVALGAAAALRERFAPREHLRRSCHALLPGLVNAHSRASLALLRACLPRGAAAAAAVLRHGTGADFVREGTRFAIAQMLRAGVTTFADLSGHPEEAARAASQAQVRACLALPVGEDGSDGLTAQLARAEKLWDQYRADPRISLYFAPATGAPLSDALLGRVRRVADELEARVALIPPAEAAAADAVRDAAPPAYGPALLERLAQLGLLRPGFTAIDVRTPRELQLIEQHGASLVLCPQASVRQLLPLPPLADEHTGLGSGDPTRAGGFDLLAEARLAALAAGWGAARALRAATLGGATALGLHSQVGSLEVGKAADLACIELEPLAVSASPGIAEAVLYGAGSGAVSDVWASGRPLLREARLLSFDPEELAALPGQWSGRLKLGAAA
ncbi:MAG TPA: amidohydrolase family protein, partial [Steroidobacteraceae bacterium]|nr:amidohydrolase family protein [Steroidobacteraceae bacterium]